MRKTLFGSASFLIVVLSTSLIGQNAYTAADHDIRFAMDTGFLYSKLLNFNGAFYRGSVEPPWCPGHHDIFLEVSEPLRLSLDGWSYSYDGRFGAQIGANTQFRVKVPSCTGTNATVDCDISTCLGLVSAEQHGVILNGQCQFHDSDFPVHWTAEVPIPFPWDAANSIPVTLTAPSSEPPNSIDLEFGHVLNGQWISDGKTRDVTVHIAGGSLGPKLAVGVQHAEEGTTLPDRFLIVDGAVGGNFKVVTYPTQQEANAFFRSDLPIWDPYNIGLSVGPSFFGNTQRGASRGLFGSLLPIRIYGLQQYHFLFWKGIAGFEFVLNDALVKFIGTGEAAHIQVSFDINRIRIWKQKGNKKTEEKSLLKGVQTILTLSRPSVGSDGNLNVKVTSFKVRLKTWFGIIPIRLSPKQLESSLNKGLLAWGKIQSRVDIELPPCIDSHWDKVTPLQACPDAGGVLKPGFVNFQSPEKNIHAKIDFSKAKFQIINNRMQLGLVMEPLRATSSQPATSVTTSEQ